MTPVSYPSVPVQPNLPVFSTDLLQTFQTFTRASYQQQFGVQAPSFDATRPAQYWFDTTLVGVPPATIVEYLQVQADPTSTGFSAQEVPLPVPAALAATPNFPGLETFPAYVIAPTAAASNGSVVNPSILSNIADAYALAIALGLTPSCVIAGPGLSWNGETRGDWMIVIPGNPNPYYAGTLLVDQYANGIGSPGAWSIRNANTSLAQAVWTPTPQGPDGISTGVPSVTTPVPVRPLLKNEQFIPAGLGGGVMVARTDLASPAVLGTTTSFTQQDAVMLAAIYGAFFPNGAAS